MGLVAALPAVQAPAKLAEGANPRPRRSWEGATFGDCADPLCWKGKAFMSEERDEQERPCLHCMMVELIDDFFAEYPATTGEPETIDTDEVVAAIAKTVADASS
jgi:hypothetical protein